MGRPKKAANPNIALPARKRKAAATTTETPAKFDVTTLPKLYKCTCCGAIYPNSADQRFYIIPHTTTLDGNDRYSGMCIKCAGRYFSEYTEMYQNRKFALLLVCSLLGAYFSERLYESLEEKDAEVQVGTYLRYLNGVQYKGKTFMTYLLEMKNQDKAFIPQGQMRELMEDNWTAADKKNKGYVIRSLGYDPFDDSSYSEADRKYLYNTMSGYLSDEVLEDPHKMISVINIVKSSLQLAQCDMLINKQMKSVSPDMDEIKNMTDTKNGLQRSINAIAKENAISAVGSGKKQKSTMALTAIMKEMLDRGIDAAKPNLSDAKMNGAYEAIAKISQRALIAEMNFTSDEYAKMVADQSEMIVSLNQKLVEVEEQNRLLEVQLDYARKAGFRRQGTVKIEAGAEDDADTE